MTLFTEKGGNLKRKDNYKQSVIYYAAREGKKILLQYLINEGLEVEENDYMMQSPLFYSAKYNKTTEITEILLKSGCDPNHKDSNGQTPLFYAAAEGNLDTCKLLIRNGANVLSTDKNKERPMHYARRNNHR